MSTPKLMAWTWSNHSVATLPLESGDLGFSDDARGPSLSAVQALLGRSLSGDKEQEDEDSSWCSADCRFSGCWRLCYGCRVLGSKQYRSRSAKHERGSTRTRSGHDTASRVVTCDPTSNFRGIAQFWVPHHGAGAANSGTTSYDSQSNVLGCSSPAGVGTGSGIQPTSPGQPLPVYEQCLETRLPRVARRDWRAA